MRRCWRACAGISRRMARTFSQRCAPPSPRTISDSSPCCSQMRPANPVPSKECPMTNFPPSSPLRARNLLLTAAVERELETRRARDRLSFYRPYPKQALFHQGGAVHNERLFMAANQVGKTLAGAMEWAMHLTGRYPPWWKGREFKGPVRMWAAGVTAESTRDNPQRVLVGPPQQRERWGTGVIPSDALKETAPARGVANAIDSLVVKWGGGGDVQQGESVLAFKSYEKGREKWQGETLDGVWFDEKPPLDIYSEGMTRCQALSCIIIITFTPLLGMTEDVKLLISQCKADYDA